MIGYKWYWSRRKRLTVDVIRFLNTINETGNWVVLSRDIESWPEYRRLKDYSPGG